MFNNEVVQDDVDAFETDVLFTPALTKEALAESTAAQFGLQLDHGNRDVSVVEHELARLVPRGSVYEFHRTSLIEARVERVVKPESIALAVFGGIAAVAALVIAGLAVSRQLQRGASDRRVLRALGIRPAGIAADGLVGVLIAVVLGSLLAAGIAVVRPGAPGVSHPGVRPRLDRDRSRHADPDCRSGHDRGRTGLSLPAASGGPPVPFRERPHIGRGPDRRRGGAVGARSRRRALCVGARP